jgi:hypothetical protein
MRIILAALFMTLATQASANLYACNPPSYGDGTKGDEPVRLEVINNAILIDGNKHIKLNGFSDKPQVHVYNKEIWSDFDIELSIVDTSNNDADNGKWPNVKRFTLRYLYHYGPDPNHYYLAYTKCKAF